MKEDVRQCVAARVDFFSTYYTVPEAVQPRVTDFCSRVTGLGEESADAAAFEAAFASRGLQEEFMALIPLCTPKPVQLTQEQKDYSSQVAKEMRKEQHIGKKVVEDIVDTGITLSNLKEYFLKEKNVKSFKICSLLDKPSRRLKDISPDYCGFSIDDHFVVGYGLDVANKYRNLKNICKIVL